MISVTRAMLAYSEHLVNPAGSAKIFVDPDRQIGQPSSSGAVDGCDVRGTATIIGMVPFGMKIELHGFDFLRDRKIQGTSMGGNRFRVDMPRLLSLWRQGRLKLDHLLSGRLKLGEINEGFAALKSAAPVRQLIDFGA